MTQRIHGVLAPVVTPFKADLAPDDNGSSRRASRCCGGAWL